MYYMAIILAEVVVWDEHLDPSPSGFPASGSCSCGPVSSKEYENGVSTLYAMIRLEGMQFLDDRGPGSLCVVESFNLRRQDA